MISYSAIFLLDAIMSAKHVYIPLIYDMGTFCRTSSQKFATVSFGYGTVPPGLNSPSSKLSVWTRKLCYCTARGLKNTILCSGRDDGNIINPKLIIIGPIISTIVVCKSIVDYELLQYILLCILVWVRQQFWDAWYIVIQRN